MTSVSDEQPGGWARPGEEQAPPAWTPPQGWAPQQPPPYVPPGQQPYVPPGQQPYVPPGQAQGGWGPPPGAFRPPPPPPKPGIIALRPLGVGEILDGAISAIRGYPRMMLGLSAVVAAITQVLIVPVTWLLLRDTGDRAFSSGADLGGDLSADPALAAVVNHALLKHHPYTKPIVAAVRSEEHTSELQSPLTISYAVFCLKKKKQR